MREGFCVSKKQKEKEKEIVRHSLSLALVVVSGEENEIMWLGPLF